MPDHQPPASSDGTTRVTLASDASPFSGAACSSFDTLHEPSPATLHRIDDMRDPLVARRIESILAEMRQRTSPELDEWSGQTDAAHTRRQYMILHRGAQVEVLRHPTAAHVGEHATTLSPSGHPLPSRFLAVDWELLAARYAMRAAPAIHAFLQQHPVLLGLLDDAHRAIRAVFGNDARPELAMSEALEGAEDRELHLLIPTRLDPAEALERLARLDETWWLDVAPRVQGLLVINVDYR